MIITNKGNASKKRRRCVITVLYGTVVVLSLGFLGTLIVLLVQNLGAAPIKKDRYDRWKVYQIPEPDQVCAGRDDQSLVFAVPSNWTVIMSVNHGFLDFFENWWVFFNDLHTEANLLVMAEDDKTYKALSSNPRPNMLVIWANHDDHRKDNTTAAAASQLQTTSEEQGDSFGSIRYKKLITTRPTRLLSALCSTNAHITNLIYADVDSVWTNNPIPAVQHLLYDKDSPQLDIVAQMDHPKVRRYGPLSYCTGFLGMKNNLKVQQLIYMWEKAIEEKWQLGLVGDAGDQPVFQEVSNSIAAMKIGLKHGSLPMDLFPPGYMYFNTTGTIDHSKVAVVHNNWIVGHRRKKLRFYLWDLWKAKEPTSWWKGEAGISNNEKLLETLLA